MKVQRQIALMQDYPRSAVMRGDEGVARIRVHVLSDGTIGDVDLIQKTGSGILDREAIRMPNRVKHIPPPPDGQPHMVEIAVQFRLGSD
ncbi:energy transducer TonB [Pacificimonas sp. WHA3]|uniref:Energy transducer TonB n=1 Tax=Pacificimonas pallii TaxID=2827236 RepID=A0ABS6SG70_9SPHN|nr:energy transducer TonB [Pacificimonas pallii]